MQYQSPFRVIIPFLNQNEIFHKLDFSLLKRKILAEFELSGKTSILINGNEFSKNDIFQLFENLKLDKNFEFHLSIFDLPGLRILLEQSLIEKEISFLHQLYQNHNFIEFISQYLATSLGQFLANQIRQKNKPVKIHFQNNLPILAEHENEFIQPISEAINVIVNDINDLCELFMLNDNFPDTKVYFSNNIISTINTIPTNYFKSDIELYLQSGINLIKFLTTPTKSGYIQLSAAKHIQKQLLKLKHLPENRKEIRQIKFPELKFLTGSSATKDPPKGCGISALSIFVFIVILLFRWACKGCGNESKNVNSQINKPEFKIVANDTLQPFDTVLDLPEVIINPENKK